MGSVTIATMVDEPPSLAVKKVHPFFTALPRSTHADSALDTTSTAAEITEGSTDDDYRVAQSGVEMEVEAMTQKRKQPKGETEQLDMRRPGRPRKKRRPSPGSTITTHFARVHQASLSPPSAASQGMAPTANIEGEGVDLPQ